MLGKRQQSVVDGAHACARRPRGRWGKKLGPLKTSASLLQASHSSSSPSVKCLTDRAPYRPPYPFLARVGDPNALFVRAFGLTGKDRFFNEKEVSLTMKCSLVPAYVFEQFLVSCTMHVTLQPVLLKPPACACVGGMAFVRVHVRTCKPTGHRS